MSGVVFAILGTGGIAVGFVALLTSGALAQTLGRTGAIATASVGGGMWVVSIALVYCKSRKISAQEIGSSGKEPAACDWTQHGLNVFEVSYQPGLKELASQMPNKSFAFYKIANGNVQIIGKGTNGNAFIVRLNQDGKLADGTVVWTGTEAINTDKIPDAVRKSTVRVQSLSAAAPIFRDDLSERMRKDLVIPEQTKAINTGKIPDAVRKSTVRVQSLSAAAPIFRGDLPERMRKDLVIPKLSALEYYNSGGGEIWYKNLNEEFKTIPLVNTASRKTPPPGAYVLHDAPRNTFRYVEENGEIRALKQLFNPGAN
ncbi:MAG: hypothetical protein H7A36_07215 [Chlamydiales bacterium]|nr:hypothetical protein [Chlamydiales bacterium]